MSERIKHMMEAEPSRNSDSRAFAQFQDDTFKSFFYFTNSIIKDTAVAESITSENYEKLWKLWENVPTDHDKRSFLYTACRNSAINYLKSATKKKRDLEVRTGSLQDMERSVPAPEEIISNIIYTEIYREIEGEIHRLPEQQKKVIELLLQGNNYNSIAAQLGLTNKTVRNYAFVAIQKMRKNLAHLENLPLLIALLDRLL